MKTISSNNYSSAAHFDTYALICIIMILPVFFLNPTLALIAAFFILCAKSNSRDGDFFCFYLFLAAWLGVFNMTKEPVGDQVAYTLYYKSVNSSSLEQIFHSIISYRSISGYNIFSVNEIFFNIFSVVIHVITRGNVPAYFFICTIVIYLLEFLAVHKFMKFQGVDKISIILVVLFISFFPPLFNQSIHLLRQFLATSFILMAVSMRVTTGKNNWPLLLMALLTHNSSIFLIVLSLLPNIYSNLKMRQFVIMIIAFVIITLVYAWVGQILSLSSIEVLSSAGSKLVLYEDETGGSVVRNLLIYCVPAFLASITIVARNKYNGGFYNSRSELVFPIISILLLMLVLGLSENPVVQFRMAYYIYSIYPFIIPFWVKPRTSNSRAYLAFLSFLSIYLFFFHFKWDGYASYGDLFFNHFFYFCDSPIFNNI